jgi:acetyl-CoA carboxylase biotin carboxylase subunit
MQPRHQKLIEKSPSPAVNADLRTRMGEAAVRAAKAVGYVNAGTVEFLLDEEGNFYFMEMNTRIQVEHPVTEMVTGVDLVEQQIKVENGEALPFSQQDIKITGHAVECRINAEDPDKGFMPCPGRIVRYSEPLDSGARIDTHVYTGYNVPPYYDSLLAKLIVHEQTRREVIHTTLRALNEYVIDGITTTIPFHKKLLQHKGFQNGRVHTKFVEEDFLGQERST